MVLRYPTGTGTHPSSMSCKINIVSSGMLLAGRYGRGYLNLALLGIGTRDESRAGDRWTSKTPAVL